MKSGRVPREGRQTVRGLARSTPRNKSRGGVSSDSIPMAAIAPLVEEWLARNTVIAFGCGYRQKDENQAGNLRLLAERSGISDRRLYAIRRGYDKKTIGRNGKTYQSFGMRFAAADRLLCAMDMNERWHTDLADYYEFDGKAA